MEFKTVATCGFGLESVLAFEIKRLGVSDVTTSDGRITFMANGEQIARANVWLRTAERVLIVLGEFRAETFDELFDNVAALRWADIIDKRDAFPVKGYSMSSVLSSVPACQSIVKKAVVESLKKSYQSPFLPENNGITKKIRFSLVKDHCTIMLDTSGDGLHKRGYRPLLNLAPIKETLAAGICDLARVRENSLMADPFCGSGTLVIEAAQRAANIAPGLRRSFAAEQYLFLGEGVFARAKAEAEEQIDRSAKFRGRGLDIDPEAVEIAKANAKRAGVEDMVSFEAGDAMEFSALDGEVVLANPPYGERLLTPKETEALYRGFGKTLAGGAQAGVYIISSHPEFESAFGEKAKRRRKLYNGMLPCQLFMYF